MKKTMKKLTVLLLTLLMALALVACGQQAADNGAADTQVTLPVADGADIGEGAAAFTVAVTGAAGETVTFTVHTDEETVGAALAALGIIDGDTTEYGLYVKSVNGEVADYDTDGSYWAFYIDGQYAAVGVDFAAIEADTVYELKVETM